MSDNAPRPITITNLRSLNTYEYQAIKDALEEYIARHGESENWSQRVILTDMLPLLMWGEL